MFLSLFIHLLLTYKDVFVSIFYTAQSFFILANLGISVFSRNIINFYYFNDTTTGLSSILVFVLFSLFSFIYSLSCFILDWSHFIYPCPSFEIFYLITLIGTLFSDSVYCNSMFPSLVKLLLLLFELVIVLVTIFNFSFT